MTCPHCREDHQDFQAVQRALEILVIKGHRTACKVAARRWLEALYDALVAALPNTLETGLMHGAASWLQESQPDHAEALRRIANKAMNVRRRG